MNPLSGVLGEAWQMYKAHARHLLAIAFVIYLAAAVIAALLALVRGRGWHVFGTLVLAWLILLAVNLVLGLIFAALPNALGRGLSSVISGTIVAPFIALVVTLVYYRLSASSETPSVPGENYGGF